MTLYRQLVLMLTLMTLLMFAGTTLLNLYQTRSFVVEQMASRARDTATVLGLSLSSYAAAGDKSTLDAVVDTIYRHGEFSEISLTDVEGQTLVDRRTSAAVEGVPAWFVDWLKLGAPSSDGDVVSASGLVGHLHVTSHPGRAYHELWRCAVSALSWFVAIAIGVALFGAAVLRLLLRPLGELEKQAQGLCERRYSAQKKLPRAREFRRVSEAMNGMTQTVQRMFQEQAESAQQLRELAYQDFVTGIGNRRFFEGQLRMLATGSERSSQGALLLVRVEGLKTINDTLGFEAGDALIEAVAVELGDLLRGREAVLSRLTGAEFGILLPNAGAAAVGTIAGRIVERLHELHKRELAPDAAVGAVGATLYDGRADPGDLLAQADEALRAAKSAGPNQWYLFEANGAAGAAVSRQDWIRYLSHAIQRRDVVLYMQPVVSGQREDQLLHREMLFRIKGPDGILCNAGQVMPVVEELGVSGRLDQLVVECVMEWMSRHGEGLTCAVKLAPGALLDDRLLDWLYQSLAALPRDKGRLVFEFSELGVVHEADRLSAFAERVRGLGHGLALDHFGRTFSDFGYLRALRPDYVKIDGGFTAAIDDSRDDQFFVKTLAGIAHSLDVRIIAEMVETDEQLEVLRGLQIDGVQGSVVGRPEPLEPQS